MCKGGCSGSADAMECQRLDPPTMGELAPAKTASQFRQQGNNKPQLVGWKGDAI